MKGSKIIVCKDDTLKFFREKDGIKCLGIIMDIYDGITFRYIGEDLMMQKFIRTLYNMVNSKCVDCLMEEDDKKVFDEFIISFLKIKGEKDRYTIENECFSNLNIDDFYQVILWSKHLLEKNIDKEYTKLDA